MQDVISSMISTSDAIWANIARMQVRRSPARILIIGTEPGAGTTSIAAATAIGLARNLRVNVRLIEANLKRPGIAGYLSLYSKRGLSDILEGRAKLEEALVKVAGCPGLSVLPGGTGRTPFPGEFATELATDVLNEATNQGDFVILDAPPLLAHAETRMLLAWVDSAVLVVRSGTTRMDAAKKALRILHESGIPVLGTVLNRFRSEKVRLRLAGREVEFDLGDVA